MDSIRALMPRTAAKGQENGDNPEINLAALGEFVKTMQRGQNKGHIWRGRRTGLLIDDRKVTKNANGHDNIDSFWENAYIDSDESSSAASSASSVVDSPGSAAEDTSWAGIVGDFEAAGGRGDDLDAEDTDNEAAADREEDSGPAKRLEYRPPPKSPMGARSEVSTDEELVAGGEGEMEAKRDDAEDDDDDTETDGDQQQEQKQLQEQQQKQLQEQQQKQLEQKQKQLQEQKQKQLQEQKQKQLEEQKQNQLQEEQQKKLKEQQQKDLKEQQQKKLQEQQQKQLQEQQQKQLQEQKQKQLEEQKQKQQQVQQQQPADAADAAAGGEGGESTPKGTPKGYPGSTRAARSRVGSARGKGKGRGAAGVEVATPMSVSGGSGKGDVNLSEAVGTRSGGKGWRKQGHHDTSSDDDDYGEGWGGGGDGGGWSFDDIREDEGDANDNADRVLPPTSSPPRGVEDGSGGKESTKRRTPSRASSRAKKSVRSDSPPSPSSPSSSRRSGMGGRTSMSPGGSASGTRASISRSSTSSSSARKGRKTTKTPASPASMGSTKRSKGKGRGKDKDSEEEVLGGGSDVDDGERRDADVDDRDVKEALPSSPADDDEKFGLGDDIDTSPITRERSKAKKVGREKNMPSSPSAAAAAAKEKENDERKKGKGKANGTRKKDNEKEVVATRKVKKVVARLSTSKGEKNDRGAGKARGARGFPSPGPPRSKEGPQFVDISKVSEVSQTPGKRRSRRHRVAPLKFWKGDNIQYGLDEKGLPVAEGIVKGPTVTPAPSRKRAKDEGGQGRRKKQARASEAMTPLKPSQLVALPKGKYMEKEEECIVWDEDTATTKRMHVVMRAKNFQDHELPATLDRPPGKEKVGKAAQAFYSSRDIFAGWLHGRLVLPPGAIKDSEHVAYSTQIYNFAAGQPNAFELAIAMPNEKANDANIFDPKTAQRFLLSPGDHFMVPMNNIYRLENHSERSEAVISWTIIKSAEA